ncbi:hypothetical protein Zmor_003011 [Zophobas morio]|uniref:Dynein heavy chain 7, axonemal n=1 Tax=Zophobas morio TaxID=2755281 RepID=A0AA38M2A7_9CUCU|nr:hypothetical protein Zmor_003011 [Zophobas morio]
MENKAKKGKLWHRIKFRNQVSPSIAPLASDSLRQFAMELKRRHRVMLYMNRVVKKKKSEERGAKVGPLFAAASTDDDIRQSCLRCPSTAMSRFQERDILRKVAARGLELRYPALLDAIMAEAREEFLSATQQAGIEMKLRSVERRFQIHPYKHLGKTDNYPVFLQRRKELKSKFILHHPLIRRILGECVTKLPYELLNLGASLRSRLDTDDFQKHIFDYANDAAQRLQEFYRNIVGLVEHERMSPGQAASHLGACTGLLSVNISRTIAHTLLHVATFTGSKEQFSYLKLTITFEDRLILSPTAEEVIDIYSKFLRKIIDGARQFYVLEKYKLKGFDNKQIYLCLTEEFFDSVLARIACNIKEKYKPILAYIDKLDSEFVDIYEDLCSRGSTIATSDLIFEEGCKKLLYFKSYLPKVAFIPDNAYFTIGQLIITEYREVLKQTLLTIVDNIFANLSAQHEWENTDICEAFDIIYVRATQKPITTEEVIEIGKYMAWVRSEYLDELKERVVKALAYLTKLIQLGPLSENHIIINAKAINWLDEILPILEENSTNYEQLKFEAEEKLQRVIEDINVDIKDVYPLLDILDSMDNIENVRSYLNTITLHMVKIKKIESKIDWINKEEVSLNFPKSSYAEFEELKNYVYPFYHLLKLCLDVQRNLSVWLDGQFDLIIYEKVKATVEKYYKELLRTQKVYRNKLRQAQDENLSLRFKGTVDDPDMLNWPAPLKLCSKAIKLIQDFEPSLAVIKIMCNEALMKRHWQKMSKVAGFDITPNAGTTLRKIIQIDLKPDIDKYELISFSATKERELLENLEQMLREWADVNFKIEDRKDIKIIIQLEDIEVVADDHIIKVINMLNSIYVKPYDDRVKDFYNKLLRITKTVQECRQAQQQWLHFFPLFLCHEITTQISAETEIFEQITNTYTNYVEMIHVDPNVYATVDNTNILPDLLDCNRQFELINRGVNRYFDKIRTYFPRFYFVSNEEMFSILSLTEDPTRIRTFIKSLFYEIRDLRFDENFTILGIVSENDEILHLTRAIETQKFHGCVEMWLKELANQIGESIRRMIQEAVKNHNQERWILQWPCQILLAVTKIIFTLDGIDAINNNTLSPYRTQIHNQTENVVKIIKSNEITNTARSNISSVLVTMSNNKDIVTKLITENVTSDQDFRWLVQLRYHLTDEGACVVATLDNRLNYGYEYLGNGENIVVTPETERCYQALMLAHKYCLCANVQGPTATGKTETIKGLAKAVAVFCTFFYCSPNVKFQVIFEFLKGVASSGCWLVLEKLDEVQLEVSSILSQEIAKVSTALRGGLNQIVLNSTEIPLQKCFIACTMKNRCHFPENFRVLFRPIVLTVPDRLIITQVKLLSFGYHQWEDLGKRIATTYQLMEDMLHFSKLDYSISSIQQILTKCANFVTSDSNEETTIYNCLRQQTTPKLASTELTVFENILLQLFPTSACQPQSTTNETIATICQNLNLDANSNFIGKIEEMQLSMKTKKGIMTVGPTFTGKTTSLRVLRELLLSDKKIDIKIICPKTLTLKQLYGGLDDNQQWCDGIITKYVREDSADEDWIILDGSADALWTEELTSLLDDNYKLCLSSGEVLHLKHTKTVIFEVEHLNQASPAMIWRCRIIYMGPDTIGWKPLLQSWLHGTNFEWQKGFEDNFTVLFHWVVPPCLEFVKTDCQQLCQVNENGLVKTTIQILEMLLIEAYEAILKKEEDVKNFSSWIQASFIQAVIWGIGANLDFDSRSKFDEFFKQLWKGQNKNYPYPASLEKVEVSVPIEEKIFDHSYLYKSKGNWKFWPDVLKNEKVEECEYLLEIFVPTNETIKYATIINMHITYNYPLLLVGPSGTGKSSCMLDIVMNKLNKTLYEPTFLTFTSSVTANQTQEMILSKLYKNKAGRYGPTEGKKSILYIDDFGVPCTDEFGTRSSLDLIRELFDHQKWYNLENFKPLYIDNVNLVATMTTTFGDQNMCQRLLRHFNVLSITELPEESILRIFSNALLTQWKKIGFPSDIMGTVNQIVSATYHFYKSILNLKPTLNCNFYYFNMKNFARVIQVCSLIRKESADTNKKLFFKLWTHEMIRVLGDRLQKKDKPWLFDNIKFCIDEHFKEEFVHLFENLPKDDNGEPDLTKLLFGTFTDKASGRFDETDVDKLREIATSCVKDTNTDPVLFGHALEHLSKICRILSIPCCNLIQVGMCGTGRQTLVKLACLIYEQSFFKVSMRENYSGDDWHRTVKSFLKEAGGYGKPCTFFLKEEQIVQDIILDDLDYLLKTGQIPFLYSLEEKQEILDVVRDSMQEETSSISGDSESIFLYYHKRCKENLHIVISFNPTNAKFRQYLKMYPSLRNFCEINYLGKWPPEALESITQAWMEDLNIAKEIKTKVVTSFSYFHKQAEKISDGVHVTIGSYLEFIKLYVKLVVYKQKKITDVKQRYLAALEKLSFAAFQISEMQKSLADYQPQLEAMTVQAVEMAKQIETETIEVEKASDLVKKDEEIANEQAAAAQVLKLDCEADLAQAIPILEDAISALNTLKPTDITLVKSMKNPPDAIKLVMAAVCVIKDVKPDRIPDPSTGRKTIDYWGPSKRILGDMNFLQTLKDFDKDNIKPEIMVKIRKDYLPHKDFKPHIVAKASSAAEGLCKWIIAMDMYDKVAKEVAPKKEKLEKAEREYGATMSILNEKKEQVTRIEQKLADLNALLREATRKQQKLQRDVDICKKKLNRAQKLIGGLSEEKIRWTNAVEQLLKQYERLPGDILLSSAFVAYLGPFRTPDRKVTLETWLNHVRDNEIPFKEDYSFAETFEKDVDFDKWHLNGLPNDHYFVENGIIGRFSQRWSLYIDPQNQATNWIKVSEKQNGIKVTKFSCPNYIDTLKQCITSGTPLLIESVGESIQPFLMNLVTRSTFRQDDRDYLDIGGHVVAYNKDFMLYLTTNLKYPTYSPEMYDKITIIDFGMNRESLEDHLLTCVVEVEKPTLKKVKKTINTERKRNKDALNNIEERILKTLSESKTDILEDELALEILDKSKILSKDIQKKQKTLVEMEGPLKEFRSGYESVAQHSTNLYFTTYQLTKINYMYQFSYNWYIETYSESIQKAHKFKELPRRRASLIDTLTYELYCKICRSIFEQDKLFFSFLLCTNLLLSEGKVSIEEVEALVQPSNGTMESQKGPDWLPHKSWTKLHTIQNIEIYQNFAQFVIDNDDDFRKIFDSKAPEEETFPEPYNSCFRKLMIISFLRPDRVFRGIYNFVKQELGVRFVKPPLFDITSSFIESYILSPLIFILKPGSDPVNSLTSFAKTKNFHNKFIIMSVRDGREQEFEDLIEKGKELGLWICLQNCHLLSSWLPLLDLKLEEIDYSNTHENFRLWLTTNETNAFPISLLERSVKITKESPQGIQNKMLNLFLNNPVSSPSFYTNCPGKHEAFIRLMYSVAFLHCIVQERHKYGPYGWNVPYSFNEDDFCLSVYELQSIINNRSDPCQEIIYLVEKCSYGGYITNQMDCRLFGVIVRDYLRLCNDFHIHGFTVPVKIDHQDCINHIVKLPELDECETFGLHENYESVRETKHSRLILQSIKITFNDTIINKKVLNVSDMIQDLLSQLPEEFALHEKPNMADIMALIILHELKSYNWLLRTIKKSLTDLDKIINESLIMTDQYEKIHTSISNNEVPASWSRETYENSYSLSNFMKDLIARIDYFRKFEYSVKQIIWLGCFFQPKALLVTIKLLHSKERDIPVDEIIFQFEKVKDIELENSILVDGLYLIGASWNEQTQSLEELPSKVVHQRLPLVSFVFKNKFANLYECALYKCINCVYSGSSNPISRVFIKTEHEAEHWIKRGAALLCQT